MGKTHLFFSPLSQRRDRGVAEGGGGASPGHALQTTGSFTECAKHRSLENSAAHAKTPTMTKLEKIEQEIAALDPKDVRKLADWLDAYKTELWGRQIEADAKAGKLDQLAEQALADHRAGRTRPL
jgi:hypothetical protein